MRRGFGRCRDGLDLTDEASIAAAAERTERPFDLMLDAAGALKIDGNAPEKALSGIEPAAMAQFALNATARPCSSSTSPPKRAKDRRAVFATLSAGVGSIGDNQPGGWYGRPAAKAALNQAWKHLGRHKAVTPAEAAATCSSVLALDRRRANAMPRLHERASERKALRMGWRICRT